MFARAKTIAVGVIVGALIVAADAGTTSLPPQALPNPALTPGWPNKFVRQTNIDDTICDKKKYDKNGKPDPHGFTWVHWQRPPTSYTNKIKLAQLKDPRYGYTDPDPSHYELNHQISIEMGGDPRDVRNLRDEPYYCEKGGKPCEPKKCSVQFGAMCEDKEENALAKMICARTITLKDAQDWIAHHPYEGYLKFVRNHT